MARTRNSHTSANKSDESDNVSQVLTTVAKSHPPYFAQIPEGEAEIHLICHATNILNLNPLSVTVFHHARARREARRDKIQKDYTSRITSIRSNMTSLHASRAAETRQKRAAQLTRLLALLRAKAEIEERLQAHVMALREAYVLRSEALQEVLGGRAQDLS
ncbi:hypothetical protein K490DRAFT_53620 [Saccharata proteae CBS 121410]|uniref:Uncharacterized protein n=1 Tax=Saccharata proteae CBS 121410 TaxID=1314787 RepID=A0A9P4I045_9PEZI|nr:hypothetical protein K490DRAFT_53620 [Saccharata proteae CBS 121410]